VSLSTEAVLERLTTKAAGVLNWQRVPANCYDGSTEAWVELRDGVEVPIGSTRLYNPIEELIHRFKDLQAGGPG
jgi:hypothetical protein